MHNLLGVKRSQTTVERIRNGRFLRATVSDRRKQYRVIHVNMLKNWNNPVNISAESMHWLKIALKLILKMKWLFGKNS